jgi:hypothetical protein
MSEQMDLVLRIWQRYSEQGVGAVEEIFTGDVVIEEWAEAPGAQSWHGHDGVHALQERWESELEGFHFEPIGEPVDLEGPFFAMLIKSVGRGRSSGVMVDWSLWMVAELRDERIAWMAYVGSLDEARAKAGARLQP